MPRGTPIYCSVSHKVFLEYPFLSIHTGLKITINIYEKPVITLAKDNMYKS